MKLKYKFAFQPIGKNYIGIAVDESATEFSGMLELNETGYDMVNLMQEETTREALIEKLLTVYNTDRETLSNYLDEVIAYLTEQGVLEP